MSAHQSSSTSLPETGRSYHFDVKSELASALQDLHEGRITSKLEGVAWAKRNLDPEWHPLIDYCWEERQDTGIHITQPAHPEAFRQTIAFMEYTTRLAETYQLLNE